MGRLLHQWRVDRLKPAIQLFAALVAATLSAGPTCLACASPENAGLCHSEGCRRQVLPQQKTPSWHRDAHSSLYHELGEQRVDEIELSPAGRKAKARRARRLVRAAERLMNDVAGAERRTRSRHRSGEWDEDVEDVCDVMASNLALATG